MANQDWETKLETEMRIVRRLIWKIRGQTEVDPKLLALNPALNLLMQFESRRQGCFKIDWFAGDGVVEV